MCAIQSFSVIIIYEKSKRPSIHPSVSSDRASAVVGRRVRYVVVSSERSECIINRIWQTLHKLYKLEIEVPNIGVQSPVVRRLKNTRPSGHRIISQCWFVNCISYEYENEQPVRDPTKCLESYDLRNVHNSCSPFVPKHILQRSIFATINWHRFYYGANPMNHKVSNSIAFRQVRRLRVGDQTNLNSKMQATHMSLSSNHGKFIAI